MEIVNVSVSAIINGYYYFDENGGIIEVNVPIISSAVLPVTDRVNLEKSYSVEWVLLNQQFYVIYRVSITQEQGRVSSVTIQDLLLNEANRFSYGPLEAVSLREMQPFTTDLYLDHRGKLILRNVQNHAYPEDIITIRVPVRMTAIRAQYYVKDRIIITFSDGTHSYEEGGRTLNTIRLEEQEFYVQLTSSWENGYVYSGDYIRYTITLHNKGTVTIRIEPGQLRQAIPMETSFVGWGIDGSAEAPEGYAYDKVQGIVNDQMLTVKPEDQEESSVSYLVQVK